MGVEDEQCGFRGPIQLLPAVHRFRAAAEFVAFVPPALLPVALALTHFRNRCHDVIVAGRGIRHNLRDGRACDVYLPKNPSALRLQDLRASSTRASAVTIFPPLHPSPPCPSSRTASKSGGGRLNDMPVEAESRPLLDDRRPVGPQTACMAVRR